MDIVLYPDEPLTRKAAPYDGVGPELVKLAEDMIETMHTFDGIGLAGPQVGVSKRIFVCCNGDGETACLVNPELTLLGGCEVGEEGCLSLPEVYADVPRAAHISVRALNERGEPVEFEASGLFARVIQHETDHLDGIVFPGRMDILSREATLREWEEVRRRIEEERKVSV